MTRPTTASAAYVQRREQIDAQLTQLAGALRAHHDRAAQDPGNWGFPGNLDHISGLLAQALTFLGVAKPEADR